MNEFIAISTFLVTGLLVVIAARVGIKYLFVISAFIILATNITVLIPVEVFGVSISWAVILYSMVYLITDILSECSGRYLAYKLAACNLAVQILLWLYIWISLQVTPEPVAWADDPTQFPHPFVVADTLFSSTVRITFAAIIASLGAFLDIMFYEWLKAKGDRLVGIKSKNWRQKLLSNLAFRNNFSTIIGQTVNTALFFLVAFYGVVETPELIQIILSASAVKIVIALCDTPFIIFASKWLPKTTHGDTIA